MEQYLFNGNKFAEFLQCLSGVWFYTKLRLRVLGLILIGPILRYIFLQKILSTTVSGVALREAWSDIL